MGGNINKMKNIAKLKKLPRSHQDKVITPVNNIIKILKLFTVSYSLKKFLLFCMCN
jgi:hypothetical protein